ncbi:MAG: NAD(P)H-dependent oxidoreductase subunit E [Clostridiales bacterium]|jgi:NADH:ubiquinone oxidoreductase subunit E|nr:NAD(P)H-dependent oxidoreductase subunit E [Clostridiales bacterium]
MSCINLGTPEQETQLRAAVASLKGSPGAVMPAMQRAQGIYGYLPFAAQKFISDELDVPLEEIYGIATFYSQFALTPKGKNRIGVCMGTACYVKGAALVLSALEADLGVKTGETTPDGLFTIDATRCLGCCGLAPVLSVNDHVYGKVAPEKVAEILNQYRS